MLPDAPPLVREIVASADVESRRLGHGYVGTEHLMLGMLRMSRLRATATLEDLGVDHRRVSAAVETIVGVSDEELGNEQLPFTPRAAGVIRRVTGEAERRGPEAIGSEHVLRALLRSRGAVAGMILDDLGIETTRLAETLRAPRPEP